MKLHDLSKIKGNKSKGKRRGRGIGSGRGGHVVGRGMKGQKSRSGHRIPMGFEGGQVPLYKKMPIFGGFKNHRSKEIVSVNINVLNQFKAGSKITPESLIEVGIINKLPKHGVKILGRGDLKHKLSLSGFTFSATAKEKLENSGCTID